MSKAIGLVKFNDGEIYFTCYNGTSDFMLPFLVSQEDLSLKYHDSVYIFYEKCIYNEEHYVVPEQGETVEVYSDYGGGFYWAAKADRERLLLIDGIEPYNWSNGKPDWVKKFFHDNNMDWEV